MAKQTDYSQYENEELVKIIRSGRDADGAVILLLMSRCKPYSLNIYKRYRYSVELMELDSITYIAHRQACETFSSDRGYYMPYYGLYLQTELSNASGDNGSGFHVPYRVRDNVRLYRKAFTEFTQKHQREPTQRELIKITGLTENELTEAETAYCALYPVYLDTPITTAESDGDCTIGDLIPDQTDLAESVTQSVYVREISDKLDAVMARDLTRPEKIAVQIRMYEVDRYAVLGGLSAETVKKYYQSGLRKLRQPRAANCLRGFIDNENIYHGTGLQAFRRTGSGQPEKIALSHLQDYKFENEEQNEYKNDQKTECHRIF